MEYPLGNMSLGKRKNDIDIQNNLFQSVNIIFSKYDSTNPSTK